MRIQGSLPLRLTDASASAGNGRALSKGCVAMSLGNCRSMNVVQQDKVTLELDKKLNCI